MQAADIHKRRQVDPKLVAIAFLILIACLFYPITFALGYYDSGFSLNSRWIVIEVTLCEDHPDLCIGSEAPVQVGDRITEYDGYTFEEFNSDRGLDPYHEGKPGELITVTFIREGVEHVAQWTLPPRNNYARLVSLVGPIFVFGPFWLAGSVILVLMRPHSIQWRLLVLMNYLTAFWLATGIYSNFRVFYSSLLLHAFSWLMLPIFLHLHFVVPTPLSARRSKYAIWALYLISILFAFYELLLNPAQYFYTISIFLIAFGSIGLLIYRIAIKTTSPSDKIAARLMLTGIVLAFGPGIVIWMIPTLLNIEPPGVLATSVVMLALPLLPLFYTYAVFKRRLGEFEVRLNRLIAVYTLFVVYLVILSIVLFIRAAIPTPTNLIFAFYLLVIFAIALAILPIQDLLRRRINRLAYGSETDPDDLYMVYAYEIPASIDRDALISLLRNEILPPLRIHQSALFVREETNYIPVYADGLNLDQQILGVKELAAMTLSAGKYHPPIIPGDTKHDAFLDWVRLSLSLERRSETIGLWLFGKRDPDDFYTQKDINLLSDLARQVSIAVENTRLLETVQNELAERKRAEVALTNYADRLELIHEIDQAILEVGSSTEIAQAALDGLENLIPFSRGSVVYYGAGPEEAELLAVSGLSSIESMPEHRILIDHSPIRKTLENGDVWLVDDIVLHSAAAPSEQVLAKGGMRALLSAPLTTRGELIGSLNLGSEHPSRFDLEHRDIAIEVANSLAIAIHSARLLETVTSHSIEMQSLSARLLTVQEEERKHISHELHDEIGQVLTAITYNLAAIRRNIPEPISETAADRLVDSEELVHQVMEHIRDISLQLRPSMLQDLGLIPTLRWYINQYGERINLNVEFSADSIECPINESVETALYRFVQEGLTNAARHAQAINISVTLECVGDMIQATVKDDGIGFDPDGSDDFQASLAGTGLLGIRERLAPLGGQLRIESAVGQGTTLQARIPMGEPDEED